MDQVRWGDMKRKTFINMAWQIYVDKAMQSGEECKTTDEPSCAGKESTKQYGGTLENAIRSQMPGLDDAQRLAEEFVDTILRVEVHENGMPPEVCSPVHHPAWESHGKVACQVLSEDTVLT